MRPSEFIKQVEDGKKVNSEKNLPKIFTHTIYRLPTYEEYVDIHNHDLTVDEIINGFKYTIIGRGITTKQNKKMVYEAILILTKIFPKNLIYWKALNKISQKYGIVNENKLIQIINDEFSTLNEPKKFIAPINENKNKSDYSQTKESLLRSKSINAEMKKEILKYLGGGSTYHEGGRVMGLIKPQELKEKSKKIDGVGFGADKNGFFVYTHRARSKSHPTPDKITVKEIDFIDSTG